MSSNQTPVRTGTDARRRVLKPEHLAQVDVRPPVLTAFTPPHSGSLLPLEVLVQRQAAALAVGEVMEAGAPLRSFAAAQTRGDHSGRTEKSATALSIEATAQIQAKQRRAAAVLREAEETAAHRLQKAELRVEAILGEADATKAAVMASAQESGHAEGYAAGLAAAQAEAERIIAAAGAQANALCAEAEQEASSARDRAEAERDALLCASEEQVLSLAFAIAAQVLKAELTLRPEAILTMVRAALAKLQGEPGIVVRVSTELAKLLNDQRSALLSADRGAVTVEADSGLTPGDFLLHGEQGRVDGRVDAQVEAIWRELTAEGQ